MILVTSMECDPEFNQPSQGKGRDPFNQIFRKFRSKIQWIDSVQSETFGKQLVHLLRWANFLGRNLG